MDDVVIWECYKLLHLYLPFANSQLKKHWTPTSASVWVYLSPVVPSSFSSSPYRPLVIFSCRTPKTEYEMKMPAALTIIRDLSFSTVIAEMLPSTLSLIKCSSGFKSCENLWWCKNVILLKRKQKESEPHLSEKNKSSLKYIKLKFHKSMMLMGSNPMQWTIFRSSISWLFF